MSVKILSDSACDLPLSFYTDNGVTLFPLKVNIDGQEYEDLKTINPKTVYNAIRDGKIPKTSQPSPLAFEETFTQMAINKEKGIYIAFSSGLSGTYQSAVMILNQVKENYPEFDLTIIDSKCASLGYGLVVMEAAHLAAQNVSKEEIIKDVKSHAFYLKPGQKKRLKSALARKRDRKKRSRDRDSEQSRA